MHVRGVAVVQGLVQGSMRAQGCHLNPTVEKMHPVSVAKKNVAGPSPCSQLLVKPVQRLDWIDCAPLLTLFSIFTAIVLPLCMYALSILYLALPLL